MAGRLRRARAEQANELVLGFIRILELVHMDVLVALLVLAQDVGVAPPELIRQQDQVVEVRRVVGQQQLLVALVDPRGDLFVELVDALGKLRWAE